MAKKKKLTGDVLKYAEMKKRFGDNCMKKVSEFEPDDIVPTGSLDLDLALGVGGITAGRSIEIFGEQSSGKTTLAIMIEAQAQKKGYLAAFIDAEHTFDPKYATKLGLDVSKLVYLKPSDAEQGLNDLVDVIELGAGIIVVDSVAALVPSAELVKKLGESHVALQAKLMSAAMRKLTGKVGSHKCIIIFINQVRMNITISKFGKKGGGKTTPGGMALGYYMTNRLDVKIGKYIDHPTEKLDKWNYVRIGQKVKIEVSKNKVGKPWTIAEFDLMYGQGIDVITDVFKVALKTGAIISKGSGHYYLNTEKVEEKLAHGEDKAIKFLTDHPGLVEDLTVSIREYIGKENE